MTKAGHSHRGAGGRTSRTQSGTRPFAVGRARQLAARVMVVNGVEAVRDGLRVVLDSTGDIEVVDEAPSIELALDRAGISMPDVAIVDSLLVPSDAVSAARDLRRRHPAVQVILLVAFPDEEVLLTTAMVAGAGYALKEINGNDVARAIRSVVGGSTLLGPEMAPRVTAVALARAKERASNGAPGLTARELRVLPLLAAGRTDGEVAEELGMDEGAVSAVVECILAKIGFAAAESSPGRATGTAGARG